jgi:hypothetical protein
MLGQCLVRYRETQTQQLAEWIVKDKPAEASGGPMRHTPGIRASSTAKRRVKGGEELYRALAVRMSVVHLRTTHRGDLLPPSGRRGAHFAAVHFATLASPSLDMFQMTK